MGSRGANGEVTKRALPCVVDDWWREEVREIMAGRRPPRLEQSEMKQTELVAALVAAGHKISKFQLNRTLTGAAPLLHVVEAVSDFFGVPRPVVVTTSKEEAFALDNVRRRQLAAVDVAIATAMADRDRLQAEGVERARPKRESRPPSSPRRRSRSTSRS